jgi:hypothetical protein
VRSSLCNGKSGEGTAPPRGWKIVNYLQNNPWHSYPPWELCGGIFETRYEIPRAINDMVFWAVTLCSFASSYKFQRTPMALSFGCKYYVYILIAFSSTVKTRTTSFFKTSVTTYRNHKVSLPESMMFFFHFALFITGNQRMQPESLLLFPYI